MIIADQLDAICQFLSETIGKPEGKQAHMEFNNNFDRSV